MFNTGIVWIIILTVLLLCGSDSSAWTSEIVRFDLTKAENTAEWHPVNDLSPIKHTPEGMELDIIGGDPYAIGPARDYPAGEPLWLKLRIKSETGGGGNVFYFTDNASERQVVGFLVRAGEWQNVKVPFPPMGPGYKLRIDPPGSSGKCIISSLSLESRALLKEPLWPKPTAPDITSKSISIKSGALELAYPKTGVGPLEANINGRRMAIGMNNPLIGYLYKGSLRWFDFGKQAKTSVSPVRNGLCIRMSAVDADGAEWVIQQDFSQGYKGQAADGIITLHTTVTTSKNRTTAFLPMVTLFPGAGSFGERKHQGLFCGLEYLDDEPSSSKADIEGPAFKRQIPDSVKITIPLMAIQSEHSYIGLIWRPETKFSALFDSPDRIFHSGGHVMGVIFPGSDGTNRAEGSLLPYEGELIKANQPLKLEAFIIGDKGDNAVDAVKKYVKVFGLPKMPDTDLEFESYVSLAGAGWLDSKITENHLFRHAVWPGFGLAPSPDAPVFMEWLAGQTKDATLAKRLHEAAQEAILKVSPDSYASGHISHMDGPLPSLIYGHTEKSVESVRQHGYSLLGLFDKDGTVHYKKAGSGPDYGRTHWAPDANGLSASTVANLLQSAAICADPVLLTEGLKKLKALSKYTGGVPRGAQTWEVPLHTPDILASANLVRAYTLGYELTKDKDFLEQAKYWAWTGVPFIYLTNPTGQRVGPYSTIAVLGATNWQAPVWFGQPVQWCGLVYADALYKLANESGDFFWKKIADGITAAGIQHTWPKTDSERQGLLPDFYHLRAQTSDGPAINPGTLQLNAARMYGAPEMSGSKVLRSAGLFVHAPGSIVDTREDKQAASFTVKGWPRTNYYVLVSGLKKEPRVKIDDKDILLAAPHEYRAKEGWLILRVNGHPRIQVIF